MPSVVHAFCITLHNIKCACVMIFWTKEIKMKLRFPKRKSPGGTKFGSPVEPCFHGTIECPMPGHTWFPDRVLLHTIVVWLRKPDPPSPTIILRRWGEIENPTFLPRRADPVGSIASDPSNSKTSSSPSPRHHRKHLPRQHLTHQHLQYQHHLHLHHHLCDVLFLFLNEKT